MNDFKENMNHKAYMDVLDCKEPTESNDFYMKYYRFWRQLQTFPGDEWNDCFEDY